MASAFEFVLNGSRVSVENLAPQMTLLDFIRSQGLTGAKEGCAEGECGACAVMLVADSARRPGSVYRVVNSCLVPLPSVAGREVYSVEALATGNGLADAQRAMVEMNGSQCGYCTPGFVVSMFAEQYCAAADGRPCSREALSGNLCRCTGYRPIGDALASLGSPAADDVFLTRLASPAPASHVVQYEGFSRPAGLRECLELLAADPAARPICGNTDLGLVTNLRNARFPHLISVEDLSELREFRDERDSLEIGAALTLTEIEERWTAAPPVIGEWLRLFASPLIRNRATVGGSLATASPIGDSAPLLLALDADVRLVSLKGERMVPLSAFFTGYRQTVLEPAELIRSIRIPKPFPEYIGFYKAAKRRTDDISTVAASFAFSRDTRGALAGVRLAFGGVAPTPVRATEAERALEGTWGQPSERARACEILGRTLKPIGDHRGSAAYRSALAQSLFEKFWFEREGTAAA